jgi:hypothetical protein
MRYPAWPDGTTTKAATGIRPTDAVARVAGVPKKCVFLVMRGMPGLNFVDAGEHIPDYLPAADGQDVAGAAQLGERKARG